uniref:Uncharacterized protein n=1 Tax=Leersia perrieri TaxID=77586 RepID=A0A0D9XFP3_9ORYZ
MMPVWGTSIFLPFGCICTLCQCVCHPYATQPRIHCTRSNGCFAILLLHIVTTGAKLAMSHPMAAMISKSPPPPPPPKNSVAKCGSCGVRRAFFLRGMIAAGAGAGAGSLLLGGGGDIASAASKRRAPPPPATPEERKDPSVSGLQAKVLASKKRKEAMKEFVAKMREKGKPVQ